MGEPLLRTVAAGDTHIGQRDHNEDAILLRRELELYVLADGAGGENAGNVASSMALSTIAHEMEQMPKTRGFDVLGLPLGARRLSAAVQAANREIVHLAQTSDRFRGMGTTVVAICVETDVGVLHLAHVGDSRCYRLRGDQVELLTQDHSLANDVLELAPDLADERAVQLPKRVITRALGMASTVRVAVQSLALCPGDRFLMCSDGLTDQLEEEQIADALRQSIRPPALVKLLLDVAHAEKAQDNVAVIVFDCHGIGDADWPTPTLRARPAPRTSEGSDPEILMMHDDDDDFETKGSDSDAPELIVGSEPPRSASPSEGPELTLDTQELEEIPTSQLAMPPPRIQVLPQGSADDDELAAVRTLLGEFPKDARPGRERDPTIRFRRNCSKCGNSYEGGKDMCPNCWGD